MGLNDVRAMATELAPLVSCQSLHYHVCVLHRVDLTLGVDIGRFTQDLYLWICEQGSTVRVLDWR